MPKVYMDNAAAKPILPAVREAMIAFLDISFGNPSSLHDWGDTVREAIETARGQVAGLIGANPEEIIFTSGGTESNNLAVKGMAMARQGKGKHVVVSAIEHFSVLHSAKTLEKWGYEVSEVTVDKHGMINPEDVKRSLRDDTVLVSIMHANGEVGTIEPIQDIAEITRERKIPFHTDAVATAGTIPVNVAELGVDQPALRLVVDGEVHDGIGLALHRVDQLSQGQAAADRNAEEVALARLPLPDRLHRVRTAERAVRGQQHARVGSDAAGGHQQREDERSEAMHGRPGNEFAVIYRRPLA